MNDIRKYFEGWEMERSNLIKALQCVQTHEDFISDMAITSLSVLFSIPEVEIEGVVSFYAQFKRTKPGKYKIALCDGTACHIKGSSLIIDWISAELDISAGETDSEGLFSLETVACLGCCSLAPVMSINGKIYGKLNKKSTVKILTKYRHNG